MANQVVEAPFDGRKPSDPSTFITTLNWRDFIDCSWKDTNYKRRAIASLIQAVYLLELDRQENRTQENSLAPDFWIPFKYKPTQILVDERDGSIFGAIFEFDRIAALSELKPFKPIGAPRAVLALRGTLIRIPTMRRDFEDDFRFLAWDSLKDSVRFKVAMDAVKSVSDTYGSRNVCIAGHSLGAGFGLQMGKELAKARINVETHLFNPPSVSLAISLGNIGEKTEYVWNRIKSMLPSSSEAQVSNDVDETHIIRLKRMMPRLSRLMDAGFRKRKWVPHLYVNSNDWISYFYMHTDGTREKIADVENTDPTNEQNEAKLFVVSKEDQKFLEAHGLKQWWSSDGNVELQHDLRNSKLISMQLNSLNTGTPSQVILFYYPQYVSLATSHINIREATDYVWNILKCVPRHISGKAQINNDGEETSGIGLMSWIPQLSGLKDTGYWVCKWVPRLYGGTKEKIVRKENMDPEEGRITAKLFNVSNEQLEFLAAHGLEQWWPNEAELQQTIRNGKLISMKIKSLYTTTHWEVIKGSNPSFLSLSVCLGEKEEFILKWNSLISMVQSSSEDKVCNDGDKTSGVGFKGWIPQLSGLKDAAHWVYKWIPHLHVNKNYGTKEEVDKDNAERVNGKITSNLCVVSKEQQKFLAAHGLEQWLPNDAKLQQAIHDSKSHISMQIRSSYTNAPWPEVTKRLNPFISLLICVSNIGEKEEFLWKWNNIKSIRLSSSEIQVNNADVDDNKPGIIPFKSWMPPLPEVSRIVNLPFVSPAMSLGNTGREKAKHVWDRLKSMHTSSNEAQVRIDSDKTASVGLKSWIPSLSGLKDAASGVGKLVPYLYANKSGDKGEKMVDKENKGPLQYNTWKDPN